ncbi:3-hydroxyisobutyryl-CoA hydrolase-like protein 1, mitochondrial [Andrographis paniculata]|uniref:3-hydroxyisobutyryl-CoA hydrolase-like protein 1, mitochondrial n=1 Tax=Andrographis paniculata TaxID=175694 RepID=UPI0021E6F69A|nr:3-hydroxyisobutyryl-CoA hydrolase-like protein 1, mitochondrial [Andrographis paniculata]XP_051147285.1 3-hydroxyisobutyryl-CoA hydrolase-like protein 1, mitochondrial [Andrographis paniculata]
MRSCKSALLLRRLLSRTTPSYGCRRLASLSGTPLVDDSDNLVLVEGGGNSRTAILNRPHSLNAINTAMVDRLQSLYRSWEEDPDVGFVVLKGRDKAFAAGGDIVSIYNMLKEGNLEACKHFFWTIYSFIYFLGTYLKPHVALLNGITMGGGAGISIPGTFRIATDKTIFATPETLIGFHPDAGASFYLSHLPGYLGEYLALTGDRLNGAEMLSCGLATHFTSITKLPSVQEKLRNLVTDDPSVIEASLGNHGDVVQLDKASVIHRIETVDKCFCHDTVEEIIESLEEQAAKTNDKWCILTLKKLKEAAPLSLKVSLRSIREGRFQTLDQCLIREYRMSLQGISGQISGDFQEGIRAKLVDKDFTPKWDPPSLEHVSQDMVDQYCTPLSSSKPDLELPTMQREAFT